jgi:hypothetical protein
VHLLLASLMNYGVGLALGAGFLLSGCASWGAPPVDYLHDQKAAAKFYCDPDGLPGGRSPFIPRGGEKEACDSYVNGDWR